MSNRLKKGIAIFTSLTTIVWLSGVAMLAPMGASAVEIKDGDLIKTADNPDVYVVKIVGSKKFKRLILSPHVFNSYGHLKWENIKVVDQATMDSYTTSNLVRCYDPDRGVDDPKVYKLTPNGDTGTKQWLNMTPREFEAAGYDWDAIYIINVPDRDAYTTGSEITYTAEEEEEEVAEAGTLSVALAVDTPVATLIPARAARVPFTKITLVATGGDVTIDSLTIERKGFAQDSNFDSVCVIDADTNQKIGLDKTLNSSHRAVLNDDIEVKAGTTKNIILAGNMASSLQAGETPQLSLVAMTLKGDATLNASLPITGNAMTMNNTITIATVTLGTGGSNPTSDSNPKIGDTDVNFTEVKLTNDSQEEVELEQITFTNYGSAGDTDIENLDLVDSATGEVVATLDNLSDSKAVFTLDNPVTIGKGKNKSFMIRGDIAGGSSRTIDMSIEKYTDVLVKGKLYGFYVTPTAGSGAQSTEPRIDGTTHTIGSGTLKVSQAAISASNIAEGATQQVLGAFDFTVKGEPVIITQLGIKATLSSSSANYSDITNVTVYDSNGSVVAGPQDLSSDYTATTTDTITVPVGTTTYTVKADLSEDFDANDTIRVEITPGSNITAKGEVTGKSVTATPSTPVQSVTQTIKTASLVVSLSPNVASASVVKGTTQHTFAQLVLDASGSGEDINITQIKMSVKPTTAKSNELSNFKIYDGSTELDVSNDPDSTLSSTAGAAATTTFTLSQTLVVQKGTTKTLTIKADISRDCSSGDVFQVGLSGYNNVTATGASTGSSITPTYNASDGASMTIKDTGELTIYVSSGTPKAGLLPGNSSGLTVGVFNVNARYEDITIEKIYITADAVNSGGFDQIATLYLYDGDTLLASVTPTSSDASSATVLVDMTNSDNQLIVSAGESKDITIKVDTAPVSSWGSSGSATSGQGFKLKINSATDVYAKGNSSGTSLATSAKDITCVMKEFVIYKSVPTVTLNEDLGTEKVANSSSLTTQSSKALYKFKVAADAAGDIGLYRVSFLVTTSSATVTNLYISDGSSTVAKADYTKSPSYVLVTDSDKGNTEIHHLYFTNDGLVPNAAVDSASNVVPYTVPAGTTKTFTLYGDVTACSSGSCSIQIQFLGDSSFPSSYPASAASLNDENYENSFIWGDYNRTLSSSSGTASTAEQWTNGYRVTSASGRLVATSTAVSLSK